MTGAYPRANNLQVGAHCAPHGMNPITAEGLFHKYFWPHYPADVRADPRPFRDEDANPGRNPRLDAVLPEAAEVFVTNAPALLGVEVNLDDAGVGVLARGLTRERRDAWLAESDETSPESLIFQAIVHASAFVGEVIVRAHGGRWELRRPMWESVVRRRNGGAIAPFHWLLKCLADEEIDAVPLAYRWRVHVQMASADVDALPVITAPKRLPTLKQPSYYLLVKYLHQHLPTVTDVGDGFPSPKEFTERRYGSLGFELLHGGRVLLVHGQTAKTDNGPSVVELLWLTAKGFDHADALPTDGDVPAFVRALTGERVEVTLVHNAKPVTHRLTFRGHG